MVDFRPGRNRPGHLHLVEFVSMIHRRLSKLRDFFRRLVENRTLQMANYAIEGMAVDKRIR